MKSNRKSVTSLFSGGGGMDLGFKAAGFDVVWAADSNRDAVETYRRNVGRRVVCADLNEIDLSDIPKADIVIGGPPCQSFSLAGKRDAHDKRGQLVWRYLAIIKHVNPEAFVFENVVGLLSARDAKGERVIDLLKEQFASAGYAISSAVLNAADYGVPQRRRRVIIVGVKGDVPFVFPEPTHSESGERGRRYVSVSEALGDLPAADDGLLEYGSPVKNSYQSMMRSSSSVSDHAVPRMSKLDRYIVEHVKPGGNYMDIPPTVPSKRIRRLQREGGHTTCYGRLDPDKPAYTINTYFNRPNVGCNIHYEQDRLITVREALRLQSFPDSYEVIASSKQAKNAIVGNAVPPLLAKAIAESLSVQLSSRNAP